MLAAPGKDALRDMVFRGNRILRSELQESYSK